MTGLAAWSQLDWQTPWALLLALQPGLMHLLLRWRRNQALSYADSHLFPWAIARNPGSKASGQKWLDLLFWGLLALAAAGPRIPAAPVSIPEQRAVLRHDVDTLAVLHVSPSMLARDVQPQRLQRAKLELYDLLRRLQGERIGLVVYAGGAGLLLPPSEDYRAFEYYLKLAEPNLFDAPGTATGEALRVAAQHLNQEKSRSKAVLLVTDGAASELNGEAGAQALQAAQLLKDAGIPLFVLGVGLPDAGGGMDQTRLIELAQFSGGKYAQVSDGDADWRTLYDSGIATLPSDYHPPLAAQEWRMLYPWLLIPAILVLLLRIFSFTRSLPVGAVVLAVALFIAIAALPVQAAENFEQSAHASYLARDYTRAQILYAQVPGVTGRMGEGASAYRRKDYAYATRQFTAALLAGATPRQRAEALFNLGNSEFMLGRVAVAAEAYRDVMRYQPGNKKAQANLSFALARLAAQRAGKPNNAGIPGRRGNQVGGKLGEDIGDRPVSMAEEKIQNRLMTQEQTEAAKKVARGNAAANARPTPDKNRVAADDGAESTYLAAAKKLELVQDQPKELFSYLIKYEAEHPRPIQERR